MKYKISKGTNTYSQLADLFERIKECKITAQSLAAEMSDIEDKKDVTSLSSGFRLSGGLSGVSMKKKPDGYRPVKGYYGYYFPKQCKANKEILDRIAALPSVGVNELNSIVGFEEQSHGLTWYTRPAVNLRDEYALIKISENCEFTPNEDMIEILDSEYKILLGGD